MNKELKELLIAFGIVLMLVITYVISSFIAMALNIHNTTVSSTLSITYLDDITWDMFIFLVFFVIEILVIDDIYRRCTKDK